MTEFTGDGLQITAQDLSALNPSTEDDDRLYNHDGSSSITLTGGTTTSRRGFYLWDDSQSAWFPSFKNADLLDGKEAGDFILNNGSGSMEGDLDFANYGIINLGEASGGTGGIHLNTNHVEVHSHTAGANIRLLDSNSAVIAEAIEGGNFEIPNGNLTEQGDRVATRTWTNTNADVPNADHADSAGDADTLDGKDSTDFAASGHDHDSRYVDASGDTMSGDLDIRSNQIVGANNITAGVDHFELLTSGTGTGFIKLYDANSNQVILKGEEGGDVHVPNGQLSEQGNRVATRAWTTGGNIAAADLGFDTATQTELDNHVGTSNAHHSKTTSATDLSDVSADSVSDAHHVKTQPSDVDSSNWTDYELQKNGTDGTGIINFKT
jgi:hypothetical protein